VSSRAGCGGAAAALERASTDIGASAGGRVGGEAAWNRAAVWAGPYITKCINPLAKNVYFYFILGARLCVVTII
jgi:hypothetical protein